MSSLYVLFNSILTATNWIGLRKLEELDVSDNCLTSLSTAVIHCLKSLRLLNVSRNKLSTFPDPWACPLVKAIIIPFCFFNTNILQMQLALVFSFSFWYWFYAFTHRDQLFRSYAHSDTNTYISVFSCAEAMQSFFQFDWESSKHHLHLLEESSGRSRLLWQQSEGTSFIYLWTGGRSTDVDLLLDIFIFIKMEKSLN